VGTFRVDPALLRAVMAAVAFLFADDLPERAYIILTDPSEQTFDALSRLVEIRRAPR
jgi:hypothetical protein